MQERNAVNLDVAAALADTRGPAPPRGRPRAGRRGAGRHRRATCATTPRWSVSTGTAGRSEAGTASRAPIPTAPRRPSDPHVADSPRGRPVPFGHHAHRPGRVAFHHRTLGPRGRPRRRRARRRPPLAPTARLAVPGPVGLHGALLPRPRPPLRHDAAAGRRGHLPRGRRGDGRRGAAAGRRPRRRLAAGERVPLRRRRARQPLAVPRGGRGELLPQGQLPRRVPQGVRAPERAQRAVAARRRPDRRLPADRRRPRPADRHPHRRRRSGWRPASGWA